MVDNIAPDVPACVNRQNNDHSEQQPEAFLASLLYLHQLIHAVD
jgi:hypothetical protein